MPRRCCPGCMLSPVWALIPVWSGLLTANSMLHCSCGIRLEAGLMGQCKACAVWCCLGHRFAGDSWYPSLSCTMHYALPYDCRSLLCLDLLVYVYHNSVCASTMQESRPDFFNAEATDNGAFILIMQVRQTGPPCCMLRNWHALAL